MLALASLGMATSSIADAPSQKMVVTATKTPRKPQDVPQSVTVISGDQVRRSGATNVAEALRAITGAMVSEQGPSGAPASIGLRGSASQQVLVLLDGMRLNSAGTGAYDLSQVPVLLDEIERIEIVRGPSSALYSPEAAGGVVNIVRKKPDAPSMTLGGALGSHGYSDVSFYGTDRGNGTYYALALAYDRSKGHRENSSHGRTVAGFKIGYDLGETSFIEAAWDFMEKETGLPGALQFPSPHARSQTREAVTSLQYRGQWSRTLYVIVTACQNEEKVGRQDPEALFPGDDLRQRNVSTGVDAQLNWLMGSWNILTFGAEERGDRIVGSDAGTHRASLSSLYLQDEMRLGDSLILIIGGREDALSSFGRRFSPRMSGRYQVFENGAFLHAALGRSFRAPALDDLYRPDAPGSGLAGNRALRPERIDEYEGGIEQPLGSGAAIRFDAFKRTVRDFLLLQPDSSTTFRPVNLDRARISGTETEFRFAVSPTKSGAVSYTRLFPVDQTTGGRLFSDLSRIPHSIISGSLMMPLDELTTLSLTGRWIKNYARPDEGKWSYYSMDGKIHQTYYAHQNQKGDVFFGVKNLFNRKYETIRGFPMPGREFYGGLSVQF